MIAFLTSLELSKKNRQESVEALIRPMKGGRVGEGGGITITFMNYQSIRTALFIDVANKMREMSPKKKTQFSLLMM
jgi:hypothetical protein